MKKRLYLKLEEIELVKLKTGFWIDNSSAWYSCNLEKVFPILRKADVNGIN